MLYIHIWTQTYFIILDCHLVKFKVGFCSGLWYMIYSIQYMAYSCHFSIFDHNFSVDKAMQYFTLKRSSEVLKKKRRSSEV